MSLFTKEEALHYHAGLRKGKVEVVPTKPCENQKQLSMAYSPGVAEACREIANDPSLAYEYTAKGNLVAVVSNGSAVLGLGNIGPLAGKPVMEGKGVLFKIFADIDVFDLNIASSDVDEIVNFCKLVEPTFGGINLEDIGAPKCFEIERRCIEELNIPVFHDDQHGTAIISGAAMYSAIEMSGKKIEDLKIVVVGAGAAGIACSRFYVSMGVKVENIFMFDSRGLIHKGRTDLNEHKSQFAQDRDYGSLEEVIKDADCFLGLSKGGLLSKEMVKSMASQPIIFACANPDPEITYNDAKDAVPDCIMATGRSDYPNQVNNVLGFPFIFRGALDVNATTINEEMKVACAKALYELAKEPVPEYILKAYGVDSMEFGPDYIIPKALDLRVIEYVAPAVAKAAMDSGVARKTIDLDDYRKHLKDRLAKATERMKGLVESYGHDI